MYLEFVPKGYFSRASTYREKVASPRFVASLPLHKELLERFFFFFCKREVMLPFKDLAA